uniref:DDE Tnp4 domain-containing protein n=1 Tax=Anopheles quadriannulatus TaxID=34691 RepID=A0A182X292_ANOQN
MLPALMVRFNLFESDDESDAYSTGSEAESEESEQIYRESFPYLLEDEWFLKCFHVSRDIFKSLYDGIAPTLLSQYEATVYDRIAATLRYLATGTCTSDRGVGGYKAMPRAEFQAMFPQTLNAIRQLICNQHISLKPQNRDEQWEATSYFRRILGPTPGVAFCAVGTHIPIAEPSEQKHLFYYKYGTYSLNALMIFDHRKRIRYVNASFCGAMHDSHLWNSSGVDSHFAQQHAKGNEKCNLLANSMFPSQPWIIKPKPGIVDPTFNARHERALATADTAVHLLKNRFKCLLGKPPIPYTPPECVAVIDVCCALHNMCLDENLPDIK